MSNLSLYIHIPFCVRKCNYCDFLSSPCDEETKNKYVDTLCREMIQMAVKLKNRKADTVFLGGGTPSILSVKQITKVMNTLKQAFQILPDTEISMEMNPGTVDREKMEVYYQLGINRLSIGLQSADNEELKVLGRIHTWESFLQTWKMVREVGFTNVNIDLMSALPGQTLESYEETLRKVLALKPEHISAYSLIVEEATLFYEWFGKEEALLEQEIHKNEILNTKNMPDEVQNKKLPDEFTDRQMYEMTKKLLEEQGYYRYEISNYALKGFECKHNIGYWKRKEYLGLGLGAASLISNIRSSNVMDLQKYLTLREQNWTEEITDLSVTDQMEEFMFLGLRMMEGISPAEFEEQFGRSLQEVYGTQITKLEKQRLLEFCKETGRYMLTSQGIDVSNRVFAEFLH